MYSNVTEIAGIIAQSQWRTMQIQYIYLLYNVQYMYAYGACIIAVIHNININNIGIAKL